MDKDQRFVIELEFERMTRQADALEFEHDCDGEGGDSFATYAVRTGEVGLEQVRVSCRWGCSRRAADNVADWVGYWDVSRSRRGERHAEVALCRAEMGMHVFHTQIDEGEKRRS